MQAMVCELCGSNDIVKQDGYYVCQHCGTKYTVEEAKKLIGVVKIDKTEETDNLLLLARRAREENNSENAEKYYGMVLIQSPNNWEASFFHVYYQAMECKIAGIASAAQSIANCIDGNFALVKQLEDEKEQSTALSTIIDYSKTFTIQIAAVATKRTEQSSFSDRSRWVVEAGNILFQIENALKKHFPEKKTELVSIQKNIYDYVVGINQGYMYDYAYRVRVSRRLVSEIKAVDPSFDKQPLQEITIPSTPPAKKSGGCYVATAIYGSYDCPQVWTLRRFRDNTLAESWYGRAFIRTYYATSPTLVKWFGHADWFRNLWKPTLDKMVARLNREGVADTPYSDHRW